MAGRVDVYPMLRSITARQFLEWYYYSIIDPFDARRGDYHAALIVSALAEINRNASKRRQPFTVEDFLLEFKELEAPTRKQTSKQFREIMMMLARAQAAK